MKRNNISANEGSFKSHKAYSPQEILAAGGTTAFGRKTGKNNESIIKAIEKLPAIEPFSNDEWNDLLEQLSNDK